MKATPQKKYLFQIFIIILTKLVFDILFGSRELILGIKHVKHFFKHPFLRFLNPLNKPKCFVQQFQKFLLYTGY